MADAHGQRYIERWAMKDHDGLTERNIRGAVALGWLTADEASALVGDEADAPDSSETTGM
ncbi:hypothetical protein [Puerhibacterium puerhi]|uniref:hypothetical protein n=1 Tax=Puerhibacterium puerhi TaxID=2692623 RepID=UPI0013573B01|nr:hypothetical protein [Puerhibacterium puerhi]